MFNYFKKIRKHVGIMFGCKFTSKNYVELKKDIFIEFKKYNKTELENIKYKLSLNIDKNEELTVLPEVSLVVFALSMSSYISSIVQTSKPDDIPNWVTDSLLNHIFSSIKDVNSFLFIILFATPIIFMLFYIICKLLNGYAKYHRIAAKLILSFLEEFSESCTPNISKTNKKHKKK